MCNEKYIKKRLSRIYPKLYKNFKEKLFIRFGNFNGLKYSVCMLLAICEEYTMLKYVFDNNLSKGNEKTNDNIKNNLTHICLIYNTCPRIFLLCHEHNRYNLFIYNYENICPFDLITNKYADLLLKEKNWNKNKMVFLIEKKTLYDYIKYVLENKDIERYICSFL